MARLRISGCYHLFIYFPPPATFPAWPDQWCILSRPTSWPESGFPSGPCHSMHPDRHCLMLYTLQQSAQSILHNAYCTLHTTHCIHAVHLQCTLHITAHTATICAWQTIKLYIAHFIKQTTHIKQCVPKTIHCKLNKTLFTTNCSYQLVKSCN